MLSFYPLKKLDRTYYRTHVKACGFHYKSCEYAYANLFSWSGMYKTVYAETEDGFFFRMHHDGADYFLCPVVSPKAAERAFITLAGYEKERGGQCLNFVCLPGDFADVIKKIWPDAVITNSRDSADYIYETGRLATFSGKALHTKKNHRNRFFALYGDSYEYRAMTASDIPLCLAFNKTWYALNAAYDNFEFSNERIATTRLLENFDLLHLSGGMIFANGELCAYTLASDNYDGADTLNIHTEKGLYDVEGVYPVICSEFLLHNGSPYTYVNREDDVGDEGLRKSKLSYKPLAFEEKFSASIQL